jgi:hypothetical protein
MMTEKLRAAAQAALEFLDHYDSNYVSAHSREAARILKAALAEPTVQRPWVGLMDDEIEQANKKSWVTEQAWQSAVWWAETKLREKNT